jgi:predicted Fe-Mo cluster-binding NifX family protein
MNICIPTNQDEGLESVPYSHFGSARFFVLHDTDSAETRVISNHNQHHEHGACFPLSGLAQEQVEAVLVNSIGRRAFARLNAAGIKVFQATPATVKENLKAFHEGALKEFDPETACRGHEPTRDHGKGAFWQSILD